VKQHVETGLGELAETIFSCLNFIVGAQVNSLRTVLAQAKVRYVL